MRLQANSDHRVTSSSSSSHESIFEDEKTKNSMCLSATCGIFWQGDVLLHQLTCPCEHQYWDLFQERFVDVSHRRFDSNGRALPMKEREAQIKAKMSPEAFEASIRAQFMLHCIDCGIRRRIDYGEAGTRFDTPDFLRAMAELLEIANGNYTSRGRSISFQEVPAAASPIRSQEVPRRPREPSFSDSAADPRRSTRDTPISDTDRQPHRPAAKSQQEASLTRIPSAEGGPRTSSDSQRGPRRIVPSGVTTTVDVNPADRDQTSRRVRSSDEARPETQSRHRSSRDESKHSTARGDDRIEDASAPRPTLSDLLAKFVAFGDDHFDSIASFCEYNPAIWDEDLSDLKKFIRHYLRRGDADPARRLAQRLLMLTLSWRGSKTHVDQQKWLSKLGRSTRLQEELDERVETLLVSLGRASVDSVRR